MEKIKIIEKTFFVLTFVFLVGLIFSGYMWITEGNIEEEYEGMIKVWGDNKEKIIKNELTEKERQDYRNRLMQIKIKSSEKYVNGLNWMMYLFGCFAGTIICMGISSNLMLEITYDRLTKRGDR